MKKLSIYASQKKQVLKQVLWSVIGCLVLVTFSLPVFSSTSSETADNARVISVTADKLPSITNTRIASYSLAAIHGSRMVPIPFQFDERTKNGYVYMKHLEKKYKKLDPILGKEGFFDGDDELIFMLRDAGTRHKDRMSYSANIISEIEVRTYNNEKRYVYLTDNVRQRSEKYYVRYSSKLSRVETDYYTLKVSPKNAFMWEEFKYFEFHGTHLKKPFDTIKLEMSAKPLTPFSPNIRLSNKNLVAKVIAEKSGPIRSTTQYKLTLTYLKAPLLNMKLQIVHHEQGIRYDAFTDIPFIRRRLIAKPSLKIALDGYDLYGASVIAQSGPSTPAIVDGEISSIEEELKNVTFTNESPYWTALESHHGFTLLTRFAIESNDTLNLNVVYEDEKDTKDKSGYYKGQLPYYGISIPKVPLKGSLRIIVDLDMFNDDIDIDIKDFSKKIYQEPALNILNM